MTERAKSILYRSLEEYNNMNKVNKNKAVQKIKDNLATHHRGLKNIGMGLDEDMVAAGKEFLKRIAHE